MEGRLLAETVGKHFWRERGQQLSNKLLASYCASQTTFEFTVVCCSTRDRRCPVIGAELGTKCTTLVELGAFLCRSRRRRTTVLI